MIETVYKDGSGNVVHIGKLDNPSAEWGEYQEEIKVLPDGGRVAVSNYQKVRKGLYPSIEDQLDEIYHNGIDAWVARIRAVKESNPKLSE